MIYINIISNLYNFICETKFLYSKLYETKQVFGKPTY